MKQGELVYRDMTPSGSGTQFFFARILGCSHLGAALSGFDASPVDEIRVFDRQQFTTYAWEEVVPHKWGNYTEWKSGTKSSFSYYNLSYDEIPVPWVLTDPETGERYFDWSRDKDGNPYPGGPKTGIFGEIDALAEYFVEFDIKDSSGNRPDAKLRDRSLYRDFIDENIPRGTDISGGNPTDWEELFAGCLEVPQVNCHPIPRNEEEAKKSLFTGSLAINISEYNRHHNPASPVGSIVLMQEVEVGGEGSGVFTYMFDAPETRGTVLAKIIRAHPIGPTLPNVDDEEDPEFRMWAYEWREVDFKLKPDFWNGPVVAKQHQGDDDGQNRNSMPEDYRDKDTAVTGLDYPIRDGGDYRVGGTQISEDPPIEIGGFTANSDVEHWVTTRLGTGEVAGFESEVFNLVEEKGLFKDTIIDKLVQYQEWRTQTNGDPFSLQWRQSNNPRWEEVVGVLGNEIKILNTGVFGPTSDDGFGWNINPSPQAVNREYTAIYPVITDDDMFGITRYIMHVDIPRSNPIALNTCEFYNVSGDNEFIDVGMRGATGNRRLVPRYVSPGVDMSRLPRFMRVQPIRPGTIVHMNFPSTSFYSEWNVRYPVGHSYAGCPVPLQNRPNQNPPMFTCPNAIDTLDDPCAFKQLPFPFKLENVNEQFLNTVQPIQGSYIANPEFGQPNP